MGIAHHGSYVDWFEEARTEWMRQRGHSYRAMEDGGLQLPVVHVELHYHSSVTYEDEILVTTVVAERRRVSIKLAYEARRADDGRLVASGTTTLACVDRSGRIRRLPEGL
jgi:acyl-CoA thioester hydrolase